MEFDNDSFEGQRKNSKDNTEYVPTRCRITKPAPPKPATNPMQFVKVPTCPLYKKAQEQLKKAEEVKIVRQEVREDAEDWQMNLDNWKSSRRKRQEHIIERVVEVKKLEQEEQERGRRKTKTFNEMMEERNKRRQLSLPLYENDDSNDLSDYGIGSSSSKTDSIKDVDTDDSSVLDEKEQNTPETSRKETSEVYTYEGAIEDYRSRTKNLNNIHQFSKSSECLSEGLLLETKKSLFELQLDSNNKSESSLAQRLSEDFAQSQSIKERLLSLEKFTEQPLKIADFVKNKCITPENATNIETVNEVQEFTSPVTSTLDTDTPTTEIFSVSGDTDPEDSGIHTTDVSCSVSQADESAEDLDANSISHYIEKLHFDEEPIPPISIPVPIYDSFPMAPCSSVEPPKEKPPPPPPLEDLDTTKRIKKELHIKRWSFLGLEESKAEQCEPEVAAVLPDANSFRQQEKQLYKKVQESRDSGHSEDSGVELDRNRETWFGGPPHNVEDEITKKEREIIEMVEKEEKWRGGSGNNNAKDIDVLPKVTNLTYDNMMKSNLNLNRTPMNNQDVHNSDNKFDDEVLKVKHELLQLEKEEMIRQRSRANNRHRYSLDNLNMKDAHNEIPNPPLLMMDHRKSMPEPIPPGKPLRLVMPQAYQAPVRVQNRKPIDYNQHWLIQEAEQRRLNSQRMKHIPDNVIQTLTQRVQNRATLRSYPTLGHAQPIPMYDDSPDKMLSVSGKKKCSYCGNELGRGAAMIIESLCLFYHMECFKCCVCHMQLGDGLMGTDVRVRNQKLHCHNCYSSDDGLKFSCV